MIEEEKNEDVVVEETSKPINYKIVIYQILTISSLFVLFWEYSVSTRMDNFWLSLGYFIGSIVVSTIVFWIFPSFRKFFETDEEPPIFYLYIGFWFLMYAGVLYFDRNNVSSPKCENYKILDKGYAYFDPKLPYVTLLIENDEEDIRYNYENEDKFIIGDSVNICIKKGALGFEYAYIYQ